MHCAICGRKIARKELNADKDKFGHSGFGDLICPACMEKNEEEDDYDEL